jgi:hypothetical protein
MTAPHLALTIATILLFTAGASAAVVLPDAVTVRVYDVTNADATVTNAALAVARRTLVDAGIDVTWRQCDESIACGRPLAGGELIVRLAKAGGPANGTPASAAALRSRRGVPLGDAFVDPRARTGVLATIYVDRVAALARAAAMPLGTLLGHAIAHELGHLLLRSNRHAPQGIMRAVWLAEELRGGRAAGWQFTAQEASAMRRLLRQVR